MTKPVVRSVHAPAQPRRSWRLAAALVLLVTVAGAGGVYWWFTRPASVLAGQVVGADVQGQPIIKAEVQIVGTDRVTRTDPLGRFRFDRLPAGPIEVKASAFTFDAKTARAELTPRAQTHVEIALSGGPFPRGLVLDAASGRPVAGAKVRIEGSNRDPVATGADGSFRIPVLLDKRANILAEAAGYRSGTAFWLGDTGMLEIKLAGSAAIKGRVLADAFDPATPVANAAVRLTGSEKTVRTDTDGYFSIESLRGGQEKVGIEIAADGYVATQMTTDLPVKGDAAVGEVRLVGAATLAGTLTDRVTGKPVPGEAVGLPGTRLVAKTDADGRFTLAAVPGGEHSLRVAAEGWTSVEKTVRAAVEKNPPIDLALAGQQKLRGAVVWQGNDGASVPVAGAKVSLNGTDVSVSAGADGSFAIEGLPPWPTTVTAKAPGFRVKEMECNPRDKTAQSVALAGDSSARGRVVDVNYEPPRPVAGATVRIDQSPVVAKTDAEGKFTLEGARSGPARLFVTAPGYQAQDVPQDLQPEATGSAGDIPLTANSELEGTVVRQGSDAPIAGAELRIAGTKLTTTSDDAGHYHFTRVSPGSVQIEAVADGYQPSRLPKEIAGGKNALDVTLAQNAPAAKTVAGEKVERSGTTGAGEIARVTPAPVPDSGSREGTGGGSGRGRGGSGIGTGGPGPVGPKPGPGKECEARRSWMELPEDEKNASLVVYLSTGTRASKGRVYMVSVRGNVLDTVGLPYTATGMAFHKQKDEESGLVVAIPREQGKLMRIDNAGRASMISEKMQSLPHPVDVGIAGNSQEIFVADDLANALARTKTDGRDPEVFRQGSGSIPGGGQSADQLMSVAVTKDSHVILGSAGQPGVYRYPAKQPSGPEGRVLSEFGGVAADPQSARWAAAQGPDKILVYNGQEKVKDLSLPPGMVHYRKGLLAFSNDDGWLCVACQKQGQPGEGIWLYLCYDIAKGQYEQLFRWDAREWKPNDMPDVTYTDREISDFVVGPWMRWPRAGLPSGGKPRAASRP